MVHINGKAGILRLDITGEPKTGFVDFEGEDEPTHIKLKDVQIIGLIVSA